MKRTLQRSGLAIALLGIAFAFNYNKLDTRKKRIKLG